MDARIRIVAVLAILASVLPGCSPSATLDLITVARKGLTMAQEAQTAQRAEIVRQLDGQADALDQAFDADTRLAASGQLKDADGKTVPFSPEWVISARKGYAAARDAIGNQVRQTEALHSVRMDNLKAADEALDMASQLIVQQWSVGERIQQELLKVQRRLAHD